MPRLMHLVCGSALPAGLLFVAIAGMGVAVAQNGSPETREACTPDAMRLCSDFVPDVPKITKCMQAHYRQLSRECRVAMANEHKAHRRYHCSHHCG